MIEIQYPEPSFNVQQRDGQLYILDPLRKKWLLLRDEEWVRQNFLNYLIKVMLYPKALIAQEKVVMLGSLKKRFDILVFDRTHHPWMLVECKAREVPISEQTVDQILRYHIPLPANYLIVTNGDATFGWEKVDNKFLEISQLPEFITNR